MHSPEPEGYSIQQLAEKAGVSVRTIRFYIDEGLLAAPPVRGRYAVYDDEFLDRLELIRRLKDSFLPLKEIRERVTALSWKEVKQALSQSQSQAARKFQRQAGDSGESALTYITNLLGTSPPPARAKAQPGPLQSEPWERLVLAPGIELHIRKDLNTFDQARARQMVEYARKLFNSQHQRGA